MTKVWKNVRLISCQIALSGNTEVCLIALSDDTLLCAPMFPDKLIRQTKLSGRLWLRGASLMPSFFVTSTRSCMTENVMMRHDVRVRPDWATPFIPLLFHCILRHFPTYGIPSYCKCSGLGHLGGSIHNSSLGQSLDQLIQ